MIDLPKTCPTMFGASSPHYINSADRLPARDLSACAALQNASGKRSAPGKRGLGPMPARLSRPAWN
jgi:hypothetical protein